MFWHLDAFDDGRSETTSSSAKPPRDRPEGPGSLGVDARLIWWRPATPTAFDFQFLARPHGLVSLSRLFGWEVELARDGWWVSFIRHVQRLLTLRNCLSHHLDWSLLFVLSIPSSELPCLSSSLLWSASSSSSPFVIISCETARQCPTYWLSPKIQMLARQGIGPIILIQRFVFVHWEVLKLIISRFSWMDWVDVDPDIW